MRQRAASRRLTLGCGYSAAVCAPAEPVMSGVPRHPDAPDQQMRSHPVPDVR